MRHYLQHKIKISWLWLPCLFLLPWFHLSKLVFFMFLILSVHECAHMMVAYLFHYPIKEVTIYPFGLSATIPTLGYGSLVKEIMIIAIGPLSQLVFPFLFSLCVKADLISFSFAQYLTMMNVNIMIFNLLPVYPLDGGRLLQAFFHSLFRYKKAQQLTCLGSFLVLVLLFLTQCLKGAGALFVQFFLLFQIVLCWRDITYMQLQFFHYRVQHPVALPIIMNEKHDLYRGRHNILKEDAGWIDEHDWLLHHFCKREKR